MTRRIAHLGAPSCNRRYQVRCDISADRFSAYGYASLNREILNIHVTQIESIVKPDSTGKHIGQELVAFEGVCGPILSKTIG